jgi:hypothetical protein
MPEMIAYCGLVCSHCPTFIATQKNDDVAREKTVALYTEKFGLNLKKEDINCDGCLSVEGRKLAFCRICEIRQCCLGKGLENCAFCESPCENLLKLHEVSPEAKASFEALRKKFPGQ